MEETLRNIFKDLVRVARSEGLRFVRNSAVHTLLRVLRGVRSVLLLNYVIGITCFLNAFGLFFALLILSLQLGQGWNSVLNPALYLCSGLFLFTSTLLVMTLREKMWIKVIGIEKFVDASIRDHESASHEIDEEMIERIVEKVLSKKRKEQTKRPKRPQTEPSES